VRDAVDATRGEILVYDGRAVDAVYSHSCGGVIAAAHDIWGGPPLGYSRRLADRLMEREVADLSSREAAVAWTTRPVEAFCNPEQEGFPNYAKAHFRWERTFEAETLDALMDRRFETGAVERVTVEARSPSGRVRRLAIVGEKRTVRLERELEIRAALGDLKSNFFTLTTERDERGALRRLKVNGAGFGHGVGLCQMGAFMMARQGYNHRQILGFYFAEVSVRRLYGP
jgi:SpoIID/LytB domain protein